LGNWTAWTASSRSRRWKRRKKRNAVARAWTWVIGVALIVAIVVGVVWEFADQVEFQRSRRTTMRAAALDVIRGTDFPSWQRDVLGSLEQGVTYVGQGNTSQAEIVTDKATTLLKAARLKSASAEPDFFQITVSALDRIWSQQPDDEGLFRRVTEARIELAGLRVAQSGPSTSARADVVSDRQAERGDADDVIPAVEGTPVSVSNGPRIEKPLAEAKGVSFTVPRPIAANYMLSPATLGSPHLDATHMPDMAEILLPPATRSLEDNVRVENLTIEGGSQTLSGIRWLNVTFVGTRLRYETGPVDFENVRFVRCTFEFSTDERGSRLANAIALGQTSFTWE
jgi:hypothetical protein